MELEVSIYPDPLVIATELGVLADRIDHDEGPMGSSLDILIGSIDRAFMEEGPGWAPWSESYSKSVGSAHGPRFDQESLLIRDATMISAVTSPTAYEISFDRIEYTGEGTPDYTEFHLDGTSKMPERNFLIVDDQAVTEIQERWEKWLANLADDVQGL